MMEVTKSRTRRHPRVALPEGAATVASRFARNRGGAAIAEFALLVPILLMFVFGIIEFSRAMYAKAELGLAVHQTLRYAMIATTVVETEVEAQMAANFTLLDPLKITNVDVVSTPNADLTSTVNITVSYSFELMIPFFESDPIVITETKSFLKS